MTNERDTYQYKRPMRKRIGGGFEEESIIRRPRRLLTHFGKRGLMHECTACNSPDQQRSCDFSIINGSNRCMDLRFEEYCGNHIVHKYIAGSMSDEFAQKKIKKQKDRIADINNRVGGFHILFPLEGEETAEDVHRIWSELAALGIQTPEFWVHRSGKTGPEYGSAFNVSWDDIKNGVWIPKQKELKKDILRYMEIRHRLGL